MAWPKLLQQIVISASNNTLGFTLGGAQTASIDVGTYDTILEVVANLVTKLQVVHGSFAAQVIVSAVSHQIGFAQIACGVAWTINWGTTDTGLRDLLGYSGAEVVDGALKLTATKRHIYGWYSPVGVEYPCIRRRISRRVQETDAGGTSIIASSTTHQAIDLLFDACLEGHVDTIAAAAAGAIDDGYGGTLDWEGRDFATWWIDVAAKKFRYYEDADDGTVAAPGTEGTDYLECVRLDQELILEQVDSGGYTYFSVRLPVKVV